MAFSHAAQHVVSKIVSKCSPGVPFRLLWGPKRAARALLDQLGGDLGDILAQFCGHGFYLSTAFVGKLQFSDFSTSLKRNCCFYGFEGTKLRPSGLQGAVLSRSGRPKWPWTGSAERSGQQNLAGRFGHAVGRYGLGGPGRARSQTQVRSEFKVYLNDKSYD